MQLSDHFTLEEMTASDTAVRLGIDNFASAQIIENLKRTAELGELVRQALNQSAGNPANEIYLSVNSGYRCEAIEKIICQKDFRQWCHNNLLDDPVVAWPMYFAKKGHPKGQCMDFGAPRFGPPNDIVHALAKDTSVMAMVDQLILEGATATSPGWVHIGWSEHPRHKIMMAVFDSDGVPHYSEGLA